MAGFTKTQKDSFKESEVKVKALHSAPTTVEQVDISKLKVRRLPTTETVVMIYPIPGAKPSGKGWVETTMTRPNGTGVTLWVNPEEHDIDLTSSKIEVASLTWNPAKDDPGTGFLQEIELA
jgi:hypothetical protein